MLDFTSALYLGLRHPHAALRPWSQLATGRPAALREAPDAARVAQAVARLQGCERGTLGTSTLHLFWDLFGQLAQPGRAIHVDAGSYPIARWGVERAQLRAVPVRRFRHHDAAALRRQLRRDAARGLRPIVVADGFCPGCGRAAPIADYLASAREASGCLVLDDTQALGILGTRQGGGYGLGGGGSLQHAAVRGEDIVLVSSLAKGFGVPVAVLAGAAPVVTRFEAASETRMHASPPSAAVISAAGHALAVNARSGDPLRARLAQRVRHLRAALARQGLASDGGLFPVQTLRLPPAIDVPALQQALQRAGLQCVLHMPRRGRRACISLLVTAAHAPQDIARAAALIGAAVFPRNMHSAAASAAAEVHHA